MIRSPEAFIPYMLALALVLGGLLWNLGDRVGGLGRVVSFGDARIGGPFALTDQNGETRSDKDFRGRWMLVYFGYTHCPDVCPLTLEEMADVMDRLGPEAARVAPIFISIDPARDTPKVMKAYVAAFGKNFVGLTGSEKEVAQAARQYRVYYKKRAVKTGGYGMDHSGEIYLMNPDGRFATVYEEEQGPDKIADDLRKRL